MKPRLVSLFLLAIILVPGCALMPKTFVETMEPTWAAIELRDDVNYDQAWATIVDLLVRRFDLEVLDKENGYLRTGWLYSWTGELLKNYRVRVTIKFNRANKTIDVKSEANYGGPTDWTVGTDTRLLSTMKTDIMGKIGRTTR